MRLRSRIRWAARGIAPAALLLALAAPGLLTAQAAEQNSAEEPRAVWIDVPFVHQGREGCGAAALAMVMAYWAEQEGIAGGFSDGTPAQREAVRAERDVVVIQRDLFVRGDRGISASSMQMYLEQHGFNTFPLRGKWKDLEDQLSKGRPLIVALRPPGDPQLHYVVMVGVDPARHLVMMNDPAERKLLSEERAEFEREWSATHNWALLAMPESSRIPDRLH